MQAAIVVQFQRLFEVRNGLGVLAEPGERESEGSVGGSIFGSSASAFSDRDGLFRFLEAQWLSPIAKYSSGDFAPAPRVPGFRYRGAIIGCQEQ